MLGLTTRRALPLLALLPTLALGAGGWFVTTVDHLPDHIVATRPTPLSFTMRGHGRTPTSGFAPQVEARSGSSRVTVPAPESGTRAGTYTATLTLPHGGDWSIAIAIGATGRERVELLPIPAILPNEKAPPALAAAERGRRLFVAKGCVTCHERMDVGPKLAGRRYDPAWLGRFLEHPQQVRPAAPGKPEMPRLGLSQPEIAALVAFVNTGTVAGR